DYFCFFQAEDGIRDRNVTGVQTCALPIYKAASKPPLKPVQKDVLCPALKGNKLISTLLELKRPKSTIKAIGIALRIVMTDCIRVENFVEIKFKPIKKMASSRPIKVAYLAG